MRRNDGVPVLDRAAYGPSGAPSGWACWGHDVAVTTLQRAARHGPRHAYIVGGPEHVGKTTLALAFALALMCPDRDARGGACGQCATCRRIIRGTHPDVSNFDLARQALEDKGSSKHTALTIQTVRTITSSLTLRPLERPWRVVVIDDVETMQSAAQEAFLKTLEEPPPYAVIILLVTDPEVLLSTVRSRCQVVQLQRVATSHIAECLHAAGVEHSVADELAALSEGLPGWGFRAANDPELRETRAEMQRHASRWIANSTYDRVVMAVQAADAFGRDRSGSFELLDILAGMWRFIMLRQIGASSQETERTSDALTPAAVAHVRIEDLVTAVKSVQICQSDLLSNVRPRLAFESMVLDWPTVNSAG